MAQSLQCDHSCTTPKELGESTITPSLLTTCCRVGGTMAILWPEHLTFPSFQLNSTGWHTVREIKHLEFLPDLLQHFPAHLCTITLPLISGGSGGAEAPMQGGNLARPRAAVLWLVQFSTYCGDDSVAVNSPQSVSFPFLNTIIPFPRTDQ